jgi:hypothetical protein
MVDASGWNFELCNSGAEPTSTAGLCGLTRLGNNPVFEAMRGVESVVDAKVGHAVLFAALIDCD